MNYLKKTNHFIHYRREIKLLSKDGEILLIATANILIKILCHLIIVNK